MSAAGQEADNGWAANMGTIVKFPDEGRIVRFGRIDAAEESQPSSFYRSSASNGTARRSSRMLNLTLLHRRKMAVVDG